MRRWAWSICQPCSHTFRVNGFSPTSLRPRLPYFFFSSRRRHTRCSRDWSSDVCSSDLGPVEIRRLRAVPDEVARGAGHGCLVCHPPTVDHQGRAADVRGVVRGEEGDRQIGRASCRERGEISVVAVSLKRKKLLLWAIVG